MKAKIIGVVSVLVLLNACSKQDDDTSSTTVSSAASSVAASVIYEASSAAVSSIDTMASSVDATTSSVESIEQDATLSEPAALLNTHWKLMVLDSTDVATSINQPEPHLIFSTDNRVAGSDGCNSLMGTYTLEGGKLKLGEIASTKMACQEGGNEQADALQKALAKVSSFTIHVDQLELRDETGLVIARFKAVAQS